MPAHSAPMRSEMFGRDEILSRCLLNDRLWAPLTHARTGGSVWLKQWAEANDSHEVNYRVTFYILIYFAFGIGSAFLVVLQTLILWIFCSIEVS